MATGTDKSILNVRKEVLLVKTKGRPELNRDFARRLFLSKYSTKQIAQTLKCNEKTVRRIKQELIASGELSLENVSKDLPIIEADFDQECKRATGFSFFDWTKSKTKAYRSHFNFCNKVWIQVWDKPSLVQLKDVNDQLGDQLCMKFLNYFGEDKKRIRTRKVQIRYLFRFLGRHDLADRHLTVSRSRDPKAHRDLAIIEMRDFPTKFTEFVNGLDEELKTVVMFKTVAQMRTGSMSDNRGLSGLRKGEGQSYMIFNSLDDYRIKVYEKRGEMWDITQIPKEVRERIYKLYENTKEGDFVFKNVQQLGAKFGVLTKKYFGITMHFHDLRKISVTWYYALGVPLEIATMLNVGWKDLNTPKEHYLHLRQLMKKTEKKNYAEQIPNWFKEGIEEYIE